MAEQILIEFKTDTAPLQNTVDQLVKIGQISEQDAQAFNKMNAAGSKAASSIAAQTKGSLKSLKDVEKGVRSLSDAIVEGLSEGMAEALDEAGVSVDEFKKALKDAGVDVTAFTKKTEQLATAEDNLKKQLKEIKAQMVLLKAESKDTTAEYEALRRKAGELDDAIKDVNESVSRTGSDTRGLDNLIDLASGVAGGFAVAQGVTALFGDENEELQKTLLKVNAAMAVLQGLQQIQNLLSKEQFKTLGTLIGLKKIETIQTNLQAAAESKNIIVRNGAIVAQKALNVVMKANPIGILLTAFAAIAGAIAIFSGKNKEASVNVELLNRQLEEQKRILDETVESIQFRNSIDIARAKERGETELQIHVRTIQGYGKQATEYRKSILQRTAAAEKFFNIQYDQITSLETAEKSLFNLNTKAAQQTGELSEQQKAFFEGGRAILEGIIDDYRNLQQAQRAIVSTNAEFAASQAQKRREEAKKKSEQAKADAKADAAALFEIENRRLQQLAELSMKYANDETKPFEIRLLALEDYEERQKAVIRNRQSFELKAEKLTINQRKNIVDAADKEIEKLKADNLQKQNDIIHTNFVKETENEIALEKAKLSTQLALAKEGSAEQLHIKNALIEQEAKAEKLAAQGTIRDQELLAQELERINSESNRKKSENDAAFYLAKSEKLRQLLASQDNITTAQIDIAINNPKTNNEKRFQLEQEKRKIALQQTLKELADLEQAHKDSLLKDEEQYQIDRNNLIAKGMRQSAEIADADKDHQLENFQKIKEKIAQVLGYLQQAYDAFYDIQAEKRQADFDDAIARLNEQHEKEINTKNLTEAQKADIDKKYRSREAALRRQAFEADKQAKRSQAIINGALAALNALATAPTIIAGIALAAGVAITTGLQIAKINSAQPPAFKKGTKNAPKGYAWVGEEGPELVYLKGGERIHPYKESMEIAASWRGGSMLEKALDGVRRSIPSTDKEVFNNISIGNSGQFLTKKDVYQAMQQAIREGIDIPPAVSVNNTMDGDGFASYVEENGNKRAIRNQRYKINK